MKVGSCDYCCSVTHWPKICHGLMLCVAAFCWTLLLSSNMNFIFHHVCLTVHHSANTLESPCQWKTLHLLPGNAESRMKRPFFSSVPTQSLSSGLKIWRMLLLTTCHFQETTQRTFRTWCWGKKSLFSSFSAALREMEYYAWHLQGTNPCCPWGQTIKKCYHVEANVIVLFQYWQGSNIWKTHFCRGLYAGDQESLLVSTKADLVKCIHHVVKAHVFESTVVTWLPQPCQFRGSDVLTLNLMVVGISHGTVAFTWKHSGVVGVVPGT